MVSSRQDNLAITLNTIRGAFKAGIKKLLFLGSSCVYPKNAEQPIQEEALLTGPLEATNEWYAISKIAGIKLCQAYRKQCGAQFISCQPTNLYGPGDNFDLTSSHVLAALIRKAHDAKISEASEMVVWGEVPLGGSFSTLTTLPMRALSSLNSIMMRSRSMWDAAMRSASMSLLRSFAE